MYKVLHLGFQIAECPTLEEAQAVKADTSNPKELYILETCGQIHSN